MVSPHIATKYPTWFFGKSNSLTVSRTLCPTQTPTMFELGYHIFGGNLDVCTAYHNICACKLYLLQKNIYVYTKSYCYNSPDIHSYKSHSLYSQHHPAVSSVPTTILLEHPVPSQVRLNWWEEFRLTNAFPNDPRIKQKQNLWLSNKYTVRPMDLSWDIIIIHRFCILESVFLLLNDAHLQAEVG